MGPQLALEGINEGFFQCSVKGATAVLEALSNAGGDGRRLLGQQGQTVLLASSGLAQFILSCACCPVSILSLSKALTNRFLNIRLDGIRVEDPERYPHMVSY